MGQIIFKPKHIHLYNQSWNKVAVCKSVTKIGKITMAAITHLSSLLLSGRGALREIDANQPACRRVALPQTY